MNLTFTFQFTVVNLKYFRVSIDTNTCVIPTQANGVLVVSMGFLPTADFLTDDFFEVVLEP